MFVAPCMKQRVTGDNPLETTPPEIPPTIENTPGGNLTLNPRVLASLRVRNMG